MKKFTQDNTYRILDVLDDGSFYSYDVNLEILNKNLNIQNSATKNLYFNTIIKINDLLEDLDIKATNSLISVIKQDESVFNTAKIQSFLETLKDKDWINKISDRLVSEYNVHDFLRQNNVYELETIMEIVEQDLQKNSLRNNQYMYLLPNLIETYKRSENRSQLLKINAYVNKLEIMKEEEVKDMVLSELLPKSTNEWYEALDLTPITTQKLINQEINVQSNLNGVVKALNESEKQQQELVEVQNVKLKV